MPFKKIKPRQPRLKPVWHKFNCAKCGCPVSEFSDPRVSTYTCNLCLRKLMGIEHEPRQVFEQRDEGADWWTLWCYEYESKLSAGLVGRGGRPKNVGDDNAALG